MITEVPQFQSSQCQQEATGMIPPPPVFEMASKPSTVVSEVDFALDRLYASTDKEVGTYKDDKGAAVRLFLTRLLKASEQMYNSTGEQYSYDTMLNQLVYFAESWDIKDPSKQAEALKILPRGRDENGNPLLTKDNENFSLRNIFRDDLMVEFSDEVIDQIRTLQFEREHKIKQGTLFGESALLGEMSRQGQEAVSGILTESSPLSYTAHELAGSFEYQPTTLIEAGDNRFAFGAVVQPKNGTRLFAVAYTIVDNRIQPRLYYKSKSDGGWRATPGIYDDGVFSKGEFGSTEDQFGEYVQATKPVESITTYLEQTEKNPVIVDSVRPLLDKFLMKRAHEEQDSIFESEVRLHKVEGKGLDTFIAGLGYKAGLSSREIHQSLDAMVLPEGFEPSFDNIARQYVMQHTLLGESAVRVYNALLDDKAIEWHVAEDGQGRVWVDKIVYKDAEATTYGTLQDVILAGAVNAKPLEYRSQVGFGTEGDDFVSFTDNYVDLSPTIARMPWAKHYRESRSKSTSYTIGNLQQIMAG